MEGGGPEHDITDTSTVWRPEDPLEGFDAVVRVVAADGVRSVSDDSDGASRAATVQTQPTAPCGPPSWRSERSTPRTSGSPSTRRPPYASRRMCGRRHQMSRETPSKTVAQASTTGTSPIRAAAAPTSSAPMGMAPKNTRV